MRRLATLVIGVTVGAGLVLRAQQPGDAQQAPPVFRAGVDVIELDVSVLDQDGNPVTGLTQADFEVRENGRLQELVSLAYLDTATVDPVRSPRMRFVTPDVAVNNLADRVGDSRLFAIVLDDMNIPPDEAEILISTREIARYIVEQLRPSDQAAIVHVHQAGRTQDFTNDQRTLFEAIDAFDPNPPDYIGGTPRGTSQGGADMPYRYSPALARTPCMREQPGVPALEAVTSALASVPGRRKTLIFISVGLPVTFGAGDTCGATRDMMMRDVFRHARRASINIHTIDPAGYNGYRDYLDRYRVRSRGMGAMRQAPTNLRQLNDFMKVVADNTGGQAIVDTDAILPGVDRIFREYSAYYLLGYESSNGNPDGKFRDIDVKVRRDGVTVRARAGYWAPRAEDVVARRVPASAPEVDPESGLTAEAGVPMRATAAALGPSAADGRLMDVAVALAIRWPALRAPVRETLTLVRHVYEEGGRPGEPVGESLELDLAPGDERRHEIVRHLSLPPGRYEVRFNATSSVLGRSSSIYAEVEVPDFARNALSLSGLVLDGGESATGAAALMVDGPALPVVPTSRRDFANGENVTAFVRVYQGGTADLAPVAMVAEIFDVTDQEKFVAPETLDPAAFDATRGASYQLTLPFDRLESGPHLLSISAKLPTGRTVRRELIFRVR
jgi:VWFA-related protein